MISAPSAFNIISPATSRVRSPELRSISVPSIVMLSIVTPPSTSRTPAELYVILAAAASEAAV